MQLVGHVAELWRFPVKSMRGELCTSLVLTPAGVEGDRRFAIGSDDAPVGKPLLRGAQRAATLRISATTSTDDLPPSVIAADGTRRLVTDPHLLPSLASSFPTPVRLHLLHNPDRPYTDVRPVSLLSLQTVMELGQELGEPIDPIRFRSNLLLDLAPLSIHTSHRTPEDSLVGRTLRIGSAATLTILERIPRCRVVSLHPATGHPHPALLPTLARHHGGRAGVYARANYPATLSAGDPVFLLD